MKYAYVTGITNDAFAKGAAAMLLSLNESCKDKGIDRVCLATKAVSSQNIELIEKSGALIDYIDIISDGNEGRWNTTFSKLNIWKLSEYDKIIWIDADMMVLGNLDDLFRFPHMSCVRTRSPYKIGQSGEELYSFNSGFMVMHPDKAEGEQIIKTIKGVQRDYYQRGIIIGDQNVLNEYFDKWDEERERHLPDGYNVFWGSIDSYIKNGFSMHNYGEKKIFVIHFTGKHKPWQRTTWFWQKTWIRSLRYQHRIPHLETRRIMKKYSNYLTEVEKFAK